jgi:hypothetical protein
VANIALAATGERSWAEAGLAIAGAALSLIGLGAAAKAATGLAKGIAKSGGFRQAVKGGWCKFGFGKCFVAGTLIHTPDGPRPIEEIRIGDKVWAHDLVTGRDELQLVVETFVRHTTELFHLTINGERVSTTAEHPFMVAGRGWVDAAFLKTGDLLVTPEGTTTPVEAIETEQRTDADAETVYNFHVETHSNYYVHAGDTAFLVHNAGHTPKGPAKGFDRDAEWSKLPPYNGRTTGRATSSSGDTRTITSGDKANSRRELSWVNDKLRESGDLPGNATSARASDAEQKYAAQMEFDQIDDADLVINHPEGPCDVRLGCDNVLDTLLGEKSLRVHWKDTDGAWQMNPYGGKG